MKTTFGFPSEEAVANGIGHCFSRVSITSGSIFTISSPTVRKIPTLFIPCLPGGLYKVARKEPIGGSVKVVVGGDEVAVDDPVFSTIDPRTPPEADGVIDLRPLFDDQL